MQDGKTRTFNDAFENGVFTKDPSYNAIHREYIKQLVRCSASAGANYRAARKAKSDADFLNQLKIVGASIITTRERINKNVK